MMSSGELLQAFSLLRSSSISHIKSMSLKCAIELGIPYIIHNHGQRAITFSKLIESLPVHPSKTHCIYRIMRLLVHSGFFATQKTDQEEEEAYTLTNASRLLLTDDRPMAIPEHLVTEQRSHSIQDGVWGDYLGSTS